MSLMDTKARGLAILIVQNSSIKNSDYFFGRGKTISTTKKSRYLEVTTLFLINVEAQKIGSGT